MYSDTNNYKRSTETETYYGNWMRQTETVINEYPTVKFFRVCDPNTKIISDWRHINNLKQITYDEMWSKFEKNS